jgi:ribosomal protein S18 acetylase RimI-like enzyme
MRAVTLADAYELARLEYELFEEHLSEESLREEIRAGFGWLIEDEVALKAYILVRDDRRILDITRFGTRTAYQGEGLGTRLLAQALRTPRAVMLTVDHENTVAMRMYLKNGFKVVGQLPHDSGWVMRKDARVFAK